MEELLVKPVVELAALVHTGEVTGRELAEAAVRRIERLQPRLHAFLDVDGERALAEAAAPGDERPLAGVPVAIKGNVPVAGRPLTFASRFLSGHRAPADAHLVSRLREAGMTVVGLTNLPEFGILPTTEPRFGGPTRNPWDPSRTPGGSSGGAAAAVAAGMVPVAHGNDGGGSLRIPAACCHLVGLKPSRGRVSLGPALGDHFLAVEGALTRSVGDTALILDAIAGYEAGDATWAPPPFEPYQLAMRREPGRLRVAVSAANMLGAEVHPIQRDALDRAAGLLASLGHEVAEADPPLPDEDGLMVFAQVFGPAATLAVRYGQLVAGRPPEDDEIEPLSRALLDLGGGLTAHDHMLAVTRLQALGRLVVAFFADHDVLLTPALAERPPPVGSLHGCGEDPMADFVRSARFTPYTALFNVTGQPAISLPMGIGSDGLPTAVQLVGRPLGEDVLLQVAAQVEMAQPWREAVPPGLD